MANTMPFTRPRAIIETTILETGTHQIHISEWLGIDVRNSLWGERPKLHVRNVGNRAGP